jgi:hypothetical protein
MMKMIMPMASPATVSVIHVEVEPIKGKTSTASAGTSSQTASSRNQYFSYRQPQQ